MAQNGPNDHFGQSDVIANRILAFARPTWTKMVQFGLKRSISVHLGPPTVLCPKGPKIEKNQSRLKFSISTENYKRD